MEDHNKAWLDIQNCKIDKLTQIYILLTLFWVHPVE